MRALDALSAVVSETTTPPDNSVLYTSATAVIVAMIGGVVAIVTSRGRASTTREPDATFPREVNEFWVQEIAKKDARIAELEDAEETWMARAYEAGWRAP